MTPDGDPEFEVVSPEQAAINREASQRRIAENWAEREAATLELEELQRIDLPSPAQIRRMAELVELIRSRPHARPYYELAAEAGDRDAQDYLAAWDEDLDDTDTITAILKRAWVVLPESPTTSAAERLRKLLADYDEIRNAKPEDFA
ncbi:hypothetical protein [Streptomyces luteogriseus]|uniref:hypothetical protein n=1 Tax=Streptomyces luteogriseus TaxID=68233 RepID=UPI0037983BA9